MPSRSYFKVVTIGTFSIYSSVGVPAFTAAQGSLAIRTDLAQTYQNTDGAATWALLGGGGSGLPFVATNEFYVDTTAAADATNRIYPTIEEALDAAASLPANAAVVIRLRESQGHSWDMSTGTAADGSRNITFYTHDRTHFSGTGLSLSGVLPVPAGPQPRYMIFRNLRVSKFNSVFQMNAPWNFEFDGCTLAAGIDMQLDSTERDIAVKLYNCNALEENTQGGFATTMPVRFLLDQAGANDAVVECVNCQIDMFSPLTDPTPPSVIGASPDGLRQVRYTDCTLQILGEGSPGNQRNDVGAQWTVSGVAGGTLGVEFNNTDIQIVAGEFATMFDSGDPSNTIEVVWNNVNLSVVCAGDGESVSHTTFTFGTRTDGHDLNFPLEIPNRLMFGVSTVNNADRTPGFPPDAPLGCLAATPSPGNSRRPHETTWQAQYIDEGDPTQQICWFGANNTNQWEANSTNASPSQVMEMPFQGFEWLPIEVGQSGQYFITCYVGGSNTGATFAFAARLSVVVNVSGGTITIVSQSTEILTEIVAAGTAFTASVDAVNNGIAFTVNQGVENPGNINWYGYSHYHRLNA